MDIGRSLFSVFSFSCLSIQQVRRFFLLIPMAVFSNMGYAQQPHNVLLIIADDVGVDMIGAYKPLVNSESVPSTPTIDGLAEQGILFRNAWANPVCAATRATIQTGRYGFRTGIKTIVGSLPANEFSIGKMLHRDPANHHALALFGKWGLGGVGQSDPVHMGYDEYKGVLAAAIPSPAENYSNFTEYSISFAESSSCDQHVPAAYADTACVHTSSSLVTVYATKKNADDTIAWINAVHNQSSGARPWFVTLAFNAAHTPLHVPSPITRLNGTSTTDLGAGFVCGNQKTNPSDPLNHSQMCYRAMIEAMDAEIERVLHGIPQDELDRTTIIFIGDNGSDTGMAVQPFDGSNAKYSVYDGGVNVPLIISGRDVVAKDRISKALVNASDLFMTVLDIAGFDRSNLPATFPGSGQQWLHDSISLLPILQDPCADGCQIQTLRQFIYAEGGLLPGYAARDFSGYKLMQTGTGTTPKWAFYNLELDPFEHSNLVDPISGNLLSSSADPNAAQALANLRQLLGSTPFTPNIVAVNLQDPAAHSGDINGDGKVDLADILLALKHITGAQTLTATEVERGDIYPQKAGDGELTFSDLILLNKSVVTH